MRILQIALIALSLVPAFAQSPAPAANVATARAEFKIPLEHPADASWIWNRSDTPDNDCEYSWTVTARNATAIYSFGFYLYKFPRSHEARGQLQDLLKAGQASVFKEDAEGRGDMLPDAKVAVTVESGAMILRITDPALVRLIFSERPETVAIHSRSPEADYKVVHVNYR